jgi:sugar phosphate isomerase/epimerase
MTGVSPAYFLSRSGPGFGPSDICSGLPFLAETGYEAFQAEVFLESALSLWTEAATRSVTDTARNNGLHCSAFVAHFLGSVFTSGSTLSQGLARDQTTAAIAIASSIASALESPTKPIQGNNQTGSRIFVVPLPAFAWPAKPGNKKPHDDEAGSRFRDIIGTLFNLCSNAGLHLALELLPGNILGGSTAFINLTAEPGLEELGLLFDTGHFWAMGESVQDLPRTLGSHILATHLCDNDGIINLSLSPGKGTIPFPELIKALEEADYAGSMDLEIVCPRAAVESEYRQALAQFKQLTDQAFSPTGCTRQTSRHQATGLNADQQPYKETL